MKIRGRKQQKELAAAIEQARDLRRLEQDEEARELLEDAIERFPENAELRLLHATILLMIRPDDVAPEAAKAVDLAPDNPAILVRAGHLLLHRGDREAARSCAAQANELVQSDFILMGGLDNLNGSLAVFAGEDDLAEEKLRSAVERDPDSEPFARNLAVFLAERGRLQEGAEVLDEALKHIEHKDEVERMRDRMAAEAAAS
jgi:Flp pilus assembly protein TadD